MDYRNILALGFLLLCGGYFFRSLQPANATLPPYPVGTSYTSIPYENFFGQLSPNQTTNLLTIPSDKVFIITHFHTDSQNRLQDLNILEDSAIKLYGSTQDILHDSYYSQWRQDKQSSFINGKAKLIIASNTILKIENTSNVYTKPFYIEGYYADPNPPYQSFSGAQWGSGGNRVLLTVPNGRNFIITTFSIGPTSQNQELRIDGTTILNAKNYQPMQPTNTGTHNIVVEAGSTISLYAGSQPEYYLQGYYAPF